MPLAVPDLPEDLSAFLRDGAPRTLETVDGAITLLPLGQLRVETLEVTPNLSPFAAEDPHRDDDGYYEVPAVNLVLGDPRPGLDFPAWLLLWLPEERRFGSFDLDHGDLMMFAPEVRWPEIAADPDPFIRASDGGDDGPVPIWYLRPWPRYPFRPFS